MIFSPGNLSLFAAQFLCYKDIAAHVLTYFSPIFLFNKVTAWEKDKYYYKADIRSFQ